MLKKLLWISYLLIIFISCQEPTFVNSRGSLDWDFLPLEVGVISTYELNRVSYLGRLIEPEVEQFLLREEIVEKQVFADGSSLFTILESIPDLNGDWIPKKYFTIRHEFGSAISVIDNIETVELQFPLLNGFRWEGRYSLNDCPDGGEYCDYFEVADRDKEFTAGGITYPKTARIIRQNTQDPLQITEDLVEFAVYAQNIGLIYSETNQLEYASCRNNQNADCCCPDNILCTLCAGEIEFGFMEKKTLIERITPN
ncbi:MAG TPA: hypothetical protein VGA21_11340 [Cyclobacteriaceae bacterium]|jgi:hypothetical protein